METPTKILDANNKTVEDYVNEINQLARIRTALSMGSNTGTRHNAESTISRAINQRVEALSKMVLNNFNC